MSLENHDVTIGRSSYPAEACFLLLAYGLSWSIEIPAALTTAGVSHVRVSNGLQTLAQIAPALAALLTAGWFRGDRTMSAIGRSFIRIRVQLRWYAFAFFSHWQLGLWLCCFIGCPDTAYGRPIIQAVSYDCCAWSVQHRRRARMARFSPAYSARA